MKSNVVKLNLILEEVIYQLVVIATSFLLCFLLLIPEFSSTFIGYLSESEGNIFNHSSYDLRTDNKIEQSLQLLSFFCLYAPVILYMLYYHLNYSLFNVFILKILLLQHYFLLFLTFYYDVAKRFTYYSLLEQNDFYSMNIVLNSDISSVLYLFLFYQFILLYFLPLLYLTNKFNIYRWFLFLFICVFIVNCTNFFIFVEITFFLFCLLKRWLSG